MSNKYTFKTIPRNNDTNGRISFIERKNQFFISYFVKIFFKPAKLFVVVILAYFEIL